MIANNWAGTLTRVLQSIAIAALVIAPLVSTDYWRFFFFQMIVMVYIAVGFDLSYSYARILSFMHALFFAIGAYLAVPLVSSAAWSLPAVLIAATVCSGFVGLLVASVLVRMENHNPTIATVIISSIALLAANAIPQITGGDDGLLISAQSIGVAGFQVGLGPTVSLYYVAVLPLVLIIVGRLALQKSEAWMLVRAVAQNDIRAQQLGFDARLRRLVVFAISAAIAGLGGAFYALMMRHVGTSNMEVGLSINAILYAVIGGLGTAVGPLVGVLLIYPITEVISLYIVYVPILIGIILTVVSLFFSRGVIGTLERISEDEPRATIESGTRATPAPVTP